MYTGIEKVEMSVIFDRGVETIVSRTIYIPPNTEKVQASVIKKKIPQIK